MDCKGGLMKRKQCLILIAVCIVALLLSLHLTRQTALADVKTAIEKVIWPGRPTG